MSAKAKLKPCPFKGPFRVFSTAPWDNVVLDKNNVMVSGHWSCQLAADWVCTMLNESWNRRAKRGKT